MINWKVRIRNKTWWIGMIAAGLLAVQAILAPFGIKFEVGPLTEQLTLIINCVFAFLAFFFGVNADPTTAGIADSTLAMTYEIPKTKDGVTTLKEGE